MENIDKLDIILKSYGIENSNMVEEIDTMYQHSLMCQKCKELLYSDNVNNKLLSADVKKIHRENFYDMTLL